MPCRDYWTDGDIAIIEKRDLKERLDVATRVACKAMTQLYELAPPMNLIDSEMIEWFQDHQEADRQEQERLAEEKAAKAKRDRLIAKVEHYFTDEELAALKELDII